MMLTFALAGFAFFLAFCALHFYFSYKHKYWQKRGVYSPGGAKLFFSHFADVALMRTTSAEWMKKFYDQIDRDYIGVYIFGDPYLIIKNSSLLKSVLIKDFNYFMDRNVTPGGHERYSPYMMFFQKGSTWKVNRQRITPALTSGKLRSMFPLFVESSQEMVNYLERNQTVLEARDMVARYTTDVISKTAFGINPHSFDGENSKFTVNRRALFGFSWRNAFAQSLCFFKPDWVPILKPNFFDPLVMDYFSDIFLASLEARTTKNKAYSDLIDVVKELRKNNDIQMDDRQFCGHALQIFMAGFETTSGAISFTLYAFALYPHIQETARREAEELKEKYGGFTYEALHDTPYLDMCINESMRIYPPLAFLERKCIENYRIPGTDCVIEKDTAILIPTLGFHMDEKYFPEPEKFDPERFRNRLDQSSGLYYLPFGEGPRNCLGERMGRLSVKLALVSIITNFEVTKCSKTPVPVVFEPRSFLTQSNVGIPIKFAKLR
ncbi:unnamed protein product [Phyllotreta striolata]|uniref:Cytochrome P450 n=1 Tax=Phyllotreta striolata TaxID=444603 RepID=A0A9N9XL19_PHYSR|nr:unnamed protein product [Phyllotreta striolata]